MTNYLQTISAKTVVFSNPAQDQISEEDIAFALSGIMRFNGQIRQPWSVLHHLFLCEQIATAYIDEMHPANEELLDHLGEISLYFDDKHEVSRHIPSLMLHDAHEAYTGDLSTPFKREVGIDLIKSIEEKLDIAIYQKFNVSQSVGDALRWLKKIDELSLRIEANVMRPELKGAKGWQFFSLEKPHENMLDLCRFVINEHQTNWAPEKRLDMAMNFLDRISAYKRVEQEEAAASRRMNKSCQSP